jgi:putative ABC transport system substrate-binding protein
VVSRVEAGLAAGTARGAARSTGRILQIEYRYFQDRYERVPALLAELIAFDPEIIVTSTSNPAIAIHAAAPTIPMFSLGLGEPVALVLVESLSGNE